MQPHLSENHPPTHTTAVHPASPAPARLSMGSKLSIAVVALAVVLAVGFFIVQHQKRHSQELLASQAADVSGAAPLVDVVPVKYAPATQSLPLPGTTHGWYETAIYARVTGYVNNWLVDIGDKVQKGQVLANIETPDLDQQLAAAQQKYAVSQANVKVTEAASNFAKTTYDRWRDSPKGVVSEQEREEKKAEYESSVARLNAAQSQANADKATADQLLALEEFKKVTAPFDGVITSRRIDIGDLVTAGSTSATTSLYSIAQIDRIRVFVDVPQRDAAEMQDGLPANITSNEFADRKFTGSISRSSRSIDLASRTLHVEVDVPNPDLVLMPGMYVQVNFQISHKGLLQVPASALLFRTGGPHVAVVDGNGTVDFRPVKIGVDQGNFIELKSGVSPNDNVALNISSQIAQGQHVSATVIDRSADNAAPEPPQKDNVAALVPRTEPVR